VVTPAAGAPPSEQIKALIALYNEGRFLDALKRGNLLGEQFPTSFIIHNILGAVNAGLDRPTDAIASYTKALQIKPDYADAHNNLGNAFSAVGRREEAIASYTKALQIKPDNAGANNNLGLVLNYLGRHQQAIASYTKALQIKPDYAEAHYNLGIALSALGKLDEAIASFTKTLQLNPDIAGAHNNIGIALYDLGKVDEAIASYTKALQIKPDYAEAHCNLGEALRGSGKLNEAVASYTKALRIIPDYAEAHNKLGVALKDLGKHDEAIASYKNALRVKPDDARAHKNLSALYEKLNRVADMERVLNAVPRNYLDNDPAIVFQHARLSSRKENHAETLSLLEKILPENYPVEIQEEYFSFLGKTYDKLGEFEKAFAQFETQNELSRTLLLSQQNDNADTYFNSTIQLTKSWTSGDKLDWSTTSTEVEGISLAFIVGFPRSGTTLLDTILRSHPGIEVVEEKPMVRNMRARFDRIPSIIELNKLTRFDVALLRKEYLEELKLHVGGADMEKIIVDKFPLNIRNVGFIHRIFPKAKFILALRHPCDCVLSCFMQNFKINDAMANFLTLDQSAKLYAAVMELWRGYQSALNLNIGVVKYEELVQDLRGNCLPIIEFLGLEWDDNLLKYQETAKNRGWINTPSYNQVTQPLYQKASGRWVNYRDQMAPVLPILKPWIKEFGYRE